MSVQETVISLSPRFFSAKEKPFVEYGELSASLFTFDSGVNAVRIKNAVGELVMLPFQGQQIWSASFNGRNLTMKSMFEQPNPTREYLQTYGGFYIHCGATAMGVPSTGDSHPLHGELPNAPYQKAWLVLGKDEKGAYIGLGGQYKHTVAFSTHYVAKPLIKLYAGSTLFSLSMTICNLKQTPMELMYLGHANFRPVDNGRLAYSAICTAEHVRVRRSIPSHVRPGPGYKEFIEELGQRPEKHNVLKPELVFDPELVFNIDYLADSDGLAHTIQVHPNGEADYICHPPDVLNVGVRWICRTPDQDALGMLLPATAGPEGYTAEKARGNIKTIPAQGTWQFALTLGALDADEAQKIEAKIEQILKKTDK
ncbi:MAG: DUF4432 family protein [Anaerolineae bacterium]|nr:DUF4432 family protein [Anaerolineae bacterium]